MSRTAEDFNKYRNIAVEARCLMQDALGLTMLLMEDIRFGEQHEQVSYAEHKLQRSIENLNTVIGSVTGGWWDEEKADE